MNNSLLNELESESEPSSISPIRLFRLQNNRGQRQHSFTTQQQQQQQQLETTTTTTIENDITQYIPPQCCILNIIPLVIPEIVYVLGPEIITNLQLDSSNYPPGPGIQPSHQPTTVNRFLHHYDLSTGIMGDQLTTIEVLRLPINTPIIVKKTILKNITLAYQEMIFLKNTNTILTTIRIAVNGSSYPYRQVLIDRRNGGSVKHVKWTNNYISNNNTIQKWLRNYVYHDTKLYINSILFKMQSKYLYRKLKSKSRDLRYRKRSEQNTQRYLQWNRKRKMKTITNRMKNINRIQNMKKIEGNSSQGEVWLKELSHIMKNPPNIIMNQPEQDGQEEKKQQLEFITNENNGWKIQFLINVILDGIIVLSVVVNQCEQLMFFRMFMDGEDLYTISVKEIHLVYEGDGTLKQWKDLLVNLGSTPLNRTINTPELFSGYRLKSCEPYFGLFIFDSNNNESHKLQFISKGHINENDRSEQELLLELHSDCTSTLLLNIPLKELPISQLRILVHEPNAPACYTLYSIYEHTIKSYHYQVQWPSNRRLMTRDEIYNIEKNWSMRQYEINQMSDNYKHLWNTCILGMNE